MRLVRTGHGTEHAKQRPLCRWRARANEKRARRRQPRPVVEAPLRGQHCGRWMSEKYAGSRDVSDLTLKVLLLLTAAALTLYVAVQAGTILPSLRFSAQSRSRRRAASAGAGAHRNGLRSTSRRRFNIAAASASAAFFRCT